ncbi:hypothetical protein BDY21DRAFT_152627 [Lineolata rhizophorae]|uniref:Uncharacterized protein n=1 Tax=Lineolata rhizophorae TaxID=578093 RepID=A0A6A6NNA1_9PEZI|nr:hypothetical protein BDY21DRAFT_152627 [Lineolata rhizophorae]
MFCFGLSSVGEFWKLDFLLANQCGPLDWFQCPTGESPTGLVRLNADFAETLGLLLVLQSFNVQFKLPQLLPDFGQFTATIPGMGVRRRQVCLVNKWLPCASTVPPTAHPESPCLSDTTPPLALAYCCNHSRLLLLAGILVQSPYLVLLQERRKTEASYNRDFRGDGSLARAVARGCIGLPEEMALR